MQRNKGWQRKLNNLIREMTLSSPKGALDPWAWSEILHSELMPYRLKGDLLLWRMRFRKGCRGQTSWDGKKLRRWLKEVPKVVKERV